MKRMRNFCLIAVTVICAGCASAQVWMSPLISAPARMSYSIEMFEDANDRKDNAIFPDAAEIVTNAFETSLLTHGYRVIKEGEADAIISGKVLSYHRGRLFGPGPNTTVGFEVNARDAETGEMLWKASHSITTEFDITYDPKLLADTVSNELVKKLSNWAKE